MRVIGIDLGTTNSVAATAERDVKVVPNREGEALTPSVVSYLKRRKQETGEFVVGGLAMNNAANDPENTIFSIKRLMGHVYGEPHVDAVKERFSYQLAPQPDASEEDHGVKVLLGGQAMSPVEISAMILKKIKEDAEFALGDPVTDAVITVPAYFEERQRSATQRAGELAGLNVLEILDEPTAAAIAFGCGKEDERHRVMVYDMGGGTFDISIIQMTGNNYSVLEIQGDNWLGGDDFDFAIVRRILEWVKLEHGHDVSRYHGFMAKAKYEAQKAKKALSQQASTAILFTVFSVPGIGAVDVDMEITRADFEADIRPLIDRSIDLVLKAMQNQSLTPDTITAVLLVGGSTAVPCVHAALSEVFGEGKIRRNVNPMECVALGAAIRAAGLHVSKGGQKEAGPKLGRVTAMHYGIAAVRNGDPDVFVPIIEKGTAHPLDKPRSRVFYPSEANQKILRIPVYEGMNPKASLNAQQGVIEFPVREMDATQPVEISFDFDKNRLLVVRVNVVGTGQSKEEKVRRGRALVGPRNDTQQQGQSTLVEDWREELTPVLQMADHFLESYGMYMDAADRKQLEEAMVSGKIALTQNDQAAGTRAVILLQNKCFSSGIASLMFIAERYMRGAPPKVSQALARAMVALREAFMRRDHKEVSEIATQIRLTIAKLANDKSTVEEIVTRDNDGRVTVKD